MCKLDVAFHELFERIKRVGVELGYIAAHLEKERVAVLERSIDKLLVLIVLRHDLCISRVRSQIDCKSDELFSHDGLWAVDYELVDDGNALSVGECRLELVLLTHMVEQFKDKCAETWCFQDLNQLGDHASVVDLIADFCIEGQIEEQAEGNLEQ